MFDCHNGFSVVWDSFSRKSLCTCSIHVYSMLVLAIYLLLIHIAAVFSLFLFLLFHVMKVYGKRVVAFFMSMMPIITDEESKAREKFLINFLFTFFFINLSFSRFYHPHSSLEGKRNISRSFIIVVLCNFIFNKSRKQNQPLRNVCV